MGSIWCNTSHKLGVFFLKIMTFWNFSPNIFFRESESNSRNYQCCSQKAVKILQSAHTLHKRLKQSNQIVFRDVPSESNCVSIQEQRRIESGKVVDFSKKHSAIPYKKIYRDPAVWAVWIAALGNMACIQMLIVYAPTYFKHVSCGFW